MFPFLVGLCGYLTFHHGARDGNAIDAHALGITLVTSSLHIDVHFGKLVLKNHGYIIPTIFHGLFFAAHIGQPFRLVGDVQHTAICIQRGLREPRDKGFFLGRAAPIESFASIYTTDTRYRVRSYAIAILELRIKNVPFLPQSPDFALVFPIHRTGLRSICTPRLYAAFAAYRDGGYLYRV